MTHGGPDGTDLPRHLVASICSGSDRPRQELGSWSHTRKEVTWCGYALLIPVNRACRELDVQPIRRAASRGAETVRTMRYPNVRDAVSMTLHTSRDAATTGGKPDSE